MVLPRINLAMLLVGAAVVNCQGAEYGVDISMPMHHAAVSTNYAEYPWNAGSAKTPVEYQNMPIQQLGNRQAFYDEMIKGCVDYYGDKGSYCLDYERDRVDMNLRQPQSMENYTDIGFKKIRAPDKVWELIKEFWDRNKDGQTNEVWPTGNTYTNHWSSPTRVANIENMQLRGGGSTLKQAIWNAAKETISEWTHATLHESSLYGIRVYTRGSVLSPHVDRLPLVSSAIICVDTDVEEPWPLEVIGHDGRAYNITMEPGDMVLYESHSVIHGRPFPLKGEYVANLFVHFEPETHSDDYNAKFGIRNDPSEQHRKDIARGVGGHEGSNHSKDKVTGLPLYIIPGSAEAAEYISRHGLSEADDNVDVTTTTGSTLAHHYAAAGTLDKLVEVIEEEEDLLMAADENGWTPLHEGARSGSIEIVRYLLSKGADINHVTGDGKNGYSALALAHELHGPDHPISKFIESVGGVLIEPEL